MADNEIDSPQGIHSGDNNIPGEETLSPEQQANNDDKLIVEKDGLRYLNGKVLPSPEELDSWTFRGVLFIVDHPWPFLIILSGGLITLSVFFCVQVKLANFSWASLPVDSPLRPAFQDSLYDFNSGGKSGLDIFLQTVGTTSVRSSAFVTAIDAFCSALEEENFVTGVDSMVRIDKSINLTHYISIYADPYAPQNYNYSKQVLTPFYLSDLGHIARVSVGLDLLPSDQGLGKAVRKVRSLLKDSFLDGSGSSLLQTSGVTGSAATQYDTLDDIRKVIPSFIAVIGK